jgi:hypothetical protein
MRGTPKVFERSRRLVKEHDTELADHKVECPLLERVRLRIGKQKFAVVERLRVSTLAGDREQRLGNVGTKTLRPRWAALRLTAPLPQPTSSTACCDLNTRRVNSASVSGAN